MTEPVVKVYTAGGELDHDCAAAGCQVSFDGYVLVDGYTVDTADPDTGTVTSSAPLAKGGRVPGATSLGEQWDTTTAGEARRRS